jgi:hypothetical protein
MTVYLQRSVGKNMDHESALVYQYCLVERIKTKFFDPVALVNGEVSLEDCSLLVGSVESLMAAFKQMSVFAPLPDYYPGPLLTHLHRKVWLGFIADVEASIISDRPVFAKSLDWKKITGQVFDQSSGWSIISEHSSTLPMWLSKPVTWMVEYRVYVLDNKVIAIIDYDGDESIKLDMEVIENAVSSLNDAGIAPASYAFDWGVLCTGETALIEMNDGWAIGAYSGLLAKDYFNFLKVRWDQIIAGDIRNKNSCGICESGYLHEHIDYNECEFNGHKEQLPCYFSVCDNCGSEQSNSKQSAINKNIMVEFTVKNTLEY